MTLSLLHLVVNWLVFTIYSEYQWVIPHCDQLLGFT